MGEQPPQPDEKLSWGFDGRAQCVCVGWSLCCLQFLGALPTCCSHLQGVIYSCWCQEFGRDAAGEDNKFLFRRNVPPRPEEQRTIKDDWFPRSRLRAWCYTHTKHPNVQGSLSLADAFCVQTQDNTSGQSGTAVWYPCSLAKLDISHHLHLRWVRRGGRGGRACETVSLGLQALSIYILQSKLLRLRNLQGNHFDS